MEEYIRDISGSHKCIQTLWWVKEVIYKLRETMTSLVFVVL